MDERSICTRSKIAESLVLTVAASKQVGPNRFMARSSAIIYGLIFVVVSLAAAGAQGRHRGSQEPRPTPIPNPPVQANQPGPVYPAPGNPQVNMQSTTPPNTAQQPNPQQQSNPQQAALRAPDPQPTSPAVPPIVTFRDGLLTVQAVNSNLSSVITAIRNTTGI
jgi:hypothetical protein